MTTRTKLIVSLFATCALSPLNVFSKPLHIPLSIQWVLMFAQFIALGFAFYFIRRQKLEKRMASASGEAAPASDTDQQRSIRKRLLLIMVLGSAVGLCSPFWMPYTGTTLGARGDFICGVIAAAIVCVVLGFRLRKLRA